MYSVTFYLLLGVAVLYLVGGKPYNRGCPRQSVDVQRGRSKCRELPGTWRRTWQSCGMECTRSNDCDIWVFNEEWCAMYSDHMGKCNLSPNKRGDSVGGYSGCDS